MKIAKKIRLVIVIWFATRFIYIYNAKHDSFTADEMYWFSTWFGLIGFCYILREVLINPPKPEDVRRLRRDLHKLGLLFVMMFAWEVLNCISADIAYSDVTYGIMLFITGLLIALVILDK